MPSLDLYLHDRRVGVVTPDRRDRGGVEPPADVSPGLVDHLHWTLDRLRAGQEIIAS